MQANDLGRSVATARILLPVIALLAIPGSASAVQTPKPSPKAQRPASGSSLEGNRVRIGRRGPKLVLPESWVREFHDEGDNICLDTARLPKSAGDFDHEFGELVDAVLDLRDCGLHAGEEVWGVEGVTFTDLQMRVYLVETPLDRVLKRIELDGARALHRILSPGRVAKRNEAGIVRKPNEKKPPAPYEPPTKTELEKLLPARATKAKWQRRLFPFHLEFGDYGADANVDFRARRFGGHTVVLVFLYTQSDKHDKQIAAIVDSLTYDKPPPAPKRAQKPAKE